MNFLKKLFCPFHKKCRQNNITPPAYLDTIEDRGNVFLVRLKGAIDMDTLGMDRSKMTDVINTMHLYTKNVLVDFKKVTHTDSATVAALMGRLLDAEKEKKRLAIFNIPEHFRQLIEILKVDHNFLIYDNESVALSELQ